MEPTNVILQIPFDESDGATTAYDYSQSRADGTVTGAHFVTGKIGNAISFAGGDKCELNKSIFSNLNSPFSIVAWVQNGTMECGAPTKLVWCLNFQGVNNYIEVAIDAKPGAWVNVAMTRFANTFNFYVNTQCVKSLKNATTLLGVSLNQDYYGESLLGKGLLDDVKIYNVALAQTDLINEVSGGKQQGYFVDGVDFKEYGVYVSMADGILNRPKLKTPKTVNWDCYHGEAVDLMHKFYEPREITLSCFIKATSKIDFIKRVSAFEQVFDRKGTNRLTIDVHPVKPLVYEVYCKDAIEITKEWDDELMVGTFKLKLIEPEPVKRVLKHIRVGESTKTCSIRFTSAKYLNIYWGDDSGTYDVSGTNRTVTHDYAASGDYFIIITGCIDEVTDFETNAIVVWEKI